MKRKILSAIIVIAMMILMVGCQSAAKTEPAQTAQSTEATATTDQSTSEQTTTDATNEPVKANGSIILATTTSTQDSGLLDVIIPNFTAKTGIECKVVAVGTGKALQMGVDGEADVLLVHAKSSELDFVAAGDGLERFDVMYNDFVLVGPEAIFNADMSCEDAFKYLADNRIKFVSRGDDSGTNKKELAVWDAAGIEPSGDWYVSAGKGMGDVLLMANELQAVTLTDRATYLSMQDKLDLKIILEGKDELLNYYGVIAVNPNKNDQINAEGAQAFINWILSDETQALIGDYGKAEFGQPLFFPNASK